MFEKEAEEYAIVGWDKSSDPRSVFVPRIDETKFNDWRNGAEFAYNKANEWHYVKDGDLPECEEYVWCLFKDAPFPFIAKLYFGMADNGFHWKCLTTNEEYDELEVYAWKEIVLPELKESE